VTRLPSVRQLRGSVTFRIDADALEAAAGALELRRPVGVEIVSALDGAYGGYLGIVRNRRGREVHGIVLHRRLVAWEAHAVCLHELAHARQEERDGEDFGTLYAAELAELGVTPRNLRLGRYDAAWLERTHSMEREAVALAGEADSFASIAVPRRP
jgi:hypothetical protein